MAAKPAGRPPAQPNADQQIRIRAIEFARGCFPQQASLAKWSDVKALAQEIEKYIRG